MYHGQFDLDKFLYEKVIRDLKNGFFVECGAYDGIEESTCLFFEEERGWKGINIEPVPCLFDLLVINRPNSINLDYALSNKKEVKPFTHIIHPERGTYFGNGSLKHEENHLANLLNSGCTTEEFLVQCCTFKSIWDKIKEKREIDLFVLDVEGGELNAIDGILKINKKYYPKVFCVEYSMVEIKNLTSKLEQYYTFEYQHYQNAIYLRNF